MTTATPSLTQKGYDELLQENEECFDLEPADAVIETLVQLITQFDEFSSNDTLTNTDTTTTTTNCTLEERLQNYVQSKKPLAKIHPKLSNLILEHPASEAGRQKRIDLEKFHKVLSCLDFCVLQNGTVRTFDCNNNRIDNIALDKLLLEDFNESLVLTCGQVVSLIEFVSSKLLQSTFNDDDGNSSTFYLNVIEETNSIFTFMSLLGVDIIHSEGLLIHIIQCLTLMIRQSSALQLQFTANDRLRQLLKDSSSLATNDDVAYELFSSLLTLLMEVVRGCEINKVAFMRDKEAPKLLVTNLVSLTDELGTLLQRPLEAQDFSLISKCCNLSQSICQIISILCKYEHLKSANQQQRGGDVNIGGISISSAHDNAQAFSKLNLVLTLTSLTNIILNQLSAIKTKTSVDDQQQHMLEKTSFALAASVLSCVKVLAINDEIIQSFVALGFLPRITECLKLLEDQERHDTTSISTKRHSYQQQMIASTFGVIRNLCGNDEIKTTFCSNGTLAEMLVCMRRYKDNLSVQEHGCGAIAAMALRKRDNALTIMRLGGARDCITAMMRFEDHVLIQRQGCLAIRNIVSRCASELKEDLLDLGVEAVLRKAGRHQGSVDEAYAALRDLGFEVQMRKFDASGNEIKTRLFGETKANFNASYEESAGDITSRVESIVADRA